MNAAHVMPLFGAAAEVTTVRAFPAVNQHVNFEIARLRKHTPAHMTDMRALPEVKHSVTLERLLYHFEVVTYAPNN